MNKVYFSPGPDCLNAITENLLKAEKEVKICVFTISDNRIVEALRDIQLRGVRVKIITDNDKRFDKGSDINYLIERGFQVKADATPAHMHHKFAIIDNKICLTGSYNWTRSAETRNYENVLVTDSRKTCKSYNKEFNRLWAEFDYLRAE